MFELEMTLSDGRKSYIYFEGHIDEENNGYIDDINMQIFEGDDPNDGIDIDYFSLPQQDRIDIEGAALDHLYYYNED